ncbi:hydroxyisourate hydrolase [Amycolatopsis thermalba]|uniref:5-hydroxyisourate hydrolase n=1 Tax=Amycolatopsis thermalba TaxID=944492 RepID=A0ABY4NZ62_9PSEU|nr:MULTISPECIES: hydroxyisourate hydrolase [Amycolatopsis]UQS25338.1 hydroxyisourate hydrolase [Amycolatopsis thermalba]
MSLSTHVLDAARGRPAAGVVVRLERHDGQGWDLLAEARTDDDGRIRGWRTGPGTHRLVFDTGGYLGPDAFYPEAVVTFRVGDPDEHYHVPLLLSPFAFSTYRGS